MSEGKAWRRDITIWVAAVSLTAIGCCWMLKPFRYVAWPSKSAFAVLDQRTGLIAVQKDILYYTHNMTKDGQIVTNFMTPSDFDALQKARDSARAADALLPPSMRGDSLTPIREPMPH